MRRINVITQKELVDEKKIEHSVAVVIDVLLATSTIVFGLDAGIRSVKTVKDVESGFKAYQEDPEYSLLMGESKAKAIQGMMYPLPSLFAEQERLDEKKLILLTTNGTVGLEKSMGAKALYASSLLNGHAIAKDIHEQTDEDSIAIVCAGNHNRFSMEDFIGAGQLVHYLQSYSDGYTYSLADSAKVALEAYRNARENAYDVIHSAETAEMMRGNGYQGDTNMIIDSIEIISLISKMQDGEILKITR